MMTGAPEQTGQRSGLFYRILAGLVSLLVLVALVLTSVRLLLTPSYVNFEYRTPNFPTDPFGFSRADRLYWSQVALDYLLNQAGISFLADLRFADASSTRQGFHSWQICVSRTIQRSITSANSATWLT